MSPEQARGQAVDKRTDMWAFGCVLYELLAGKQAFHGDTVTEILAGVLRGEPDWAALPAATPTTVRTLLRRCLQKDKAFRLRDAGDASIELQDALAAPSPSTPVTGFAKGGWRQAVALGLAVLVGAVVAELAGWSLRQTPLPTPRPVSRFTITLPPGQQLAGLNDGPAVALSLDGGHLAYAASQGGTQQLYLRAMDSLETKAIPGTDGAVNPFFSPDGQWLGFLAGGKLKKVSVSGGAALALVDASFPLGASWSSQGIVAFAPSFPSALQQVLDAGGATQPLTRLENGEIAHVWPEFLPGGNAVLFDAVRSRDDFQVVVQSVGTAARQNLIPGGIQPRYARSGHLLFAQLGGTLMAVPFDPERLNATGAPVPVVEGVRQSGSSGATHYGVSATGSLVYVPGGVQAAQRTLVWVDRKGLEQALPAPARAYLNPRLSPDGQRVAARIRDSESAYNIWVYELARNTLTRLTSHGSVNLMGAWTPDGKRITFDSNKDGPFNLFWQLADFSGSPERLISDEYLQPQKTFQAPTSWSRDGQLLAFTDNSPTTGSDIWVLRISDRKAQPFLRTSSNESAPKFAPDGRWLAYVSDESSRDEIYVQPYPGPGGKKQISAEGGTEPVWNPNGRELFYRSGNKMMAVDTSSNTSLGFTAGTPRMLFELPYLPTANYDVSPDGQRFLMLKPTEQAQAAPTQINVVLNWFEELKQRAPGGAENDPHHLVRRCPTHVQTRVLPLELFGQIGQQAEVISL